MNEQQIQELKNLVDKLQAEGLSQDQIQAQVDAKKQEFQKIEKPYNEGMSPDFQTPTTPGAVVEETAAPDMESKSDPGSSDLQVVNNSALGPLSIRKKITGANAFIQFASGVKDLFISGVDVLNKLDLDAKLKSKKISQEEYNEKLFGIKSPGEVFKIDAVEKSEALSSKIKAQGQEDPNRSIYDEFFSSEGNIKDGIDKISNGVIEAVPSVMAAFGGVVGMGTIFASASGSAYKRKTEVEPTKTGDFKTFSTSIAQGGVELVSEMVTRGIVKGFGGTLLAKVSPQAVKNVYKATTKNIAGKITAGGILEGSSEVGAQEINRYLDYIWDENNAFGYQKINSDGTITYDTGEIFKRAFDTYLISSIIGGTLGAASPDSQLRNYANERLSTTEAKSKTLKVVNRIAKLETEYVKNPNPLIANEILELQKQVIDNKILNDKVLNSFTETELTEYATGKIAVSEAKDSLKSIEDVETQDQLQKTIEKQEKALDEQYNSQKAIILMLNFGPNATNTEIKEGVKKSKTNKLADEINNTYEDATSKADWDSSVANEAITKLYGDGQNGALARIIKNKITGEMTRLPDFSREDFISEVTTELIPHIRNFNPEKAVGDSKITLSGWINGFIDRKIAGVLGSKKASKEQFETEITGVQETQFDIDDATQETLDFVRTEPKAKEQLRDVVGITKESVQADAKQILKGKLPGILEKTGRDKNQILTEINKASKLKIADAVLEEMGGTFTDKQTQKSQFITFMDTNFDAVINAIPDASKNKLPLFDPQQVRRETVVEGDAAGKGVFEYKDVSRDEFIKYYTEIDPAKNPASEMNKLRLRKKGLADIIAQEIGKDAIAEVLQDPAVQKDFLERQKFLKKEIPQDAIPRLLQRIDRIIEGLQQESNKYKGTLGTGFSPKLITDSLIAAFRIVRKGLEKGLSFQKALSNGIEKFKKSLKGATKEQKSLAERILNYHIKTPEDLNKLKENGLIDDLSIFMNHDILNSSDTQDFATNNKEWRDLVKSRGKNFTPINMRTEVGRQKFLKTAEENGFIEKIPKSIWRSLQGTTESITIKEEGIIKGKIDGFKIDARDYGGNFPFRSVKEADAWIASIEAKGKKFAEEGIYKDMTTRVTASQYNNLENLLNDKDFVQSQKNSLEGLKQLFLTFESLMAKNPEQNIPFVAAMLSSTSAYQGHFMRTSSPVTFYEKGYKNMPYTQEHTLPASLVAKYLFLEAANGNIKKSFKHVAQNFQQGALTNKSDNKLEGIGYNGKKFTYKEKTPQNWFIKDNIWARYFNINVALQDGGIKPENIVMANGKTVANIYKVNNAGYGIKGVNFNNEVIQDFKIDEVNKENAKQVYAEKDLNKEFNEFLEKSTGIGAQKVFSRAKAEARAQRVKKGFGDYFVPPSAEDFAGLMHKTLAKGKEGEKQLKFYQDNLYTPYNVANENITRERAAMFDDFRALKNKLSNIPKTLKQLTEGGDFTKEQAVRVYMWNKQGMKIPGLSNADLKSLLQEVNNNKDLMQFANELLNITKGDGYAKPENNWLGGNIAIDLMSLMNSTKRSKHLEVWQNNVDQIFSKENLNKLEAAYGKSWVTNLNKTLQRMKTGMNRKWGGDPIIQSYLDWVNGSVGAIMFLNTRSAVLQTISNINYLNFADNNPLKAAKAFANQKQYWSDFKTIFNSDYLQERRGGNKININESELALAAEKGGIQGTVSLLLNKGFIFTKIADSFAIASGGATMYRNRINKYIKDGLSEKEATEKAFIDFKAITEETQQSSRPDRISEQQASNAGRLLLAFANTPMQYNRIIKKNAQDLVAGRGNKAEKISKIIYYSTIQNLIFNALQKALFALAFADGDEDEKEISKYALVGEGMADSLLRGSGLTGNAVVAVKNVAVDVAKRSGRPRPNFKDAAWKAATLSPPINNKLTKIRGALYSLDYVTPKNMFEPKLDNPALSAGANIISAGTNIPLDRALRKAQNIEAAMSDEAEWWQRTALLMGWGSWELGMQDNKSSSVKRNKYGERIIEERLGKEKIIKEKIIK